MLKFVMFLLLPIMLFGDIMSEQHDWYSLTQNERDTIIQGYLDAKQFDLGLTVAAIIWQESRGGKWLISTDHNDYGLYHINLYWYMKSMGIKNTIYNKSEVASILITDKMTSLSYVVAKLVIYRKRYHGNYMKVWEAYNGIGERGKVYAKKISSKVSFLRMMLVTKK